MTTKEIYISIRKSNQEKAYQIVYDINNNRIREAITQIQEWYQCDEATAAEAADLLKTDLEQIKSKNRKKDL